MLSYGFVSPACSHHSKQRCGGGFSTPQEPRVAERRLLDDRRIRKYKYSSSYLSVRFSSSVTSILHYTTSSISNSTQTTSLVTSNRFHLNSQIDHQSQQNHHISTILILLQWPLRRFLWSLEPLVFREALLSKQFLAMQK